MSDPAPASAPRPCLGIFHDPLGDISSKRVESIAAFVEAAAAPLWAPAIQVWMHLAQPLPLVAIMAALLSYSAALQGIAWGSESHMPQLGGFPGSAHI
ncbi:MAG: hypothetical protein ACLQMF_20300 [Rectinemataceae bacterium]